MDNGAAALVASDRPNRGFCNGVDDGHAVELRRSARPVLRPDLDVCAFGQSQLRCRPQRQMLVRAGRQVSTRASRASRFSPNVRISTPSTVRRRDRPHRLPSFSTVAAVTDVLALGLIRGEVQAHLAVAPVAEQPLSSTPTSLPVWTNTRSDPPTAARSCSPSTSSRHRSEWSRLVGPDSAVFM